jgi:hypothetical protein
MTPLTRGARRDAYVALAQRNPSKAWIELDYCTLIAREDPAEARRLFAAVKERTPASSPVWDRVKKLEKTYE